MVNLPRGPKQPGRPRGDALCVDCKREGLGVKSAPKAYGSYCKRHAYARQTASRAVSSTQIPFVIGNWSESSKGATETLITRLDNTIHAEAGLVPAKNYKTGMRVAWAFEHACVRRALELGRRMTVQEEDEIIAAWGGARDGKELKSLDHLRDVIKGQEEEYTEPIRLPDQLSRLKFRAFKNGGPTCVAEPEFADYYRMQFNSEPPSEYVPEVPEEDEYVEYDGMTVLKSVVPTIEAAKKAGTWNNHGTVGTSGDKVIAINRDWSTKAPVEDPPNYIPSDPEAIMSVSELMAEYGDDN